MPPAHQLLRFSGTLAAMERAAGDLRSLLEERGLSDQFRHNIELVFDEIASNIVRYGSTTADIQVSVDIDANAATLTFEDDGIPFDPTVQATPALPESLDEAQVGGLGVMLVRSVTNSMTYERTAKATNRLTLVIPG